MGAGKAEFGGTTGGYGEFGLGLEGQAGVAPVFEVFLELVGLFWRDFGLAYWASFGLGGFYEAVFAEKVPTCELEREGAFGVAN